jgi:FlaA1/EpsC-like NDP-sugar epimerase
LHSTIGANAQLLGLLDDDSFKHGKLFHGYPVLGSLDDLDVILARTPFEEIVIAQEALSATQLAALESFAASHQITLRRFMLGVTDMAAPTISDRQLTTA